MEEQLVLSKRERKEQTASIVSFLSMLHPELLNDVKWMVAVEIRPILRSQKEQNIQLKRSLSLWSLDKESISHLDQFLDAYNGIPVCLYYSVYNYDLEKTDKKNITKRGKITSEAALSTQEIALDFDGINFSDYVELIDYFESLGIYAVWVFTGHGYQAHILLDEPVSDRDHLKKAVYKFRAKGFACDPNCIDPARVMRLPETFNCKGFSDSNYAEEVDNPPKCRIMQESATRYSLQDIFQKLDSLPTISEEDDAVYQQLFPMESTEESDTILVDGTIHYPYLNRFALPDAIQKMLRLTKQGFRNKVLGFLINQFKVQYRLSKNEIEEIVTIWGEKACDPPYEPDELKKDFWRLYYQYNGLRYDASLEKEFGTIDFGALIELRKQDIFIPNKFFQSFPDLSDLEVKTYLGLLLLEHLEQPTSVVDITQKLNCSERSIRLALPHLLKLGLIYKKQGNRKKGISDQFFTSKIMSKSDGFKVFGYNDISAYINELCESPRSHGELKLYLFMRYKFYSGEFFCSQENLALHTGMSRRSISDNVKKLEEKKFLKVKHVKRIRYRLESCEYTLLR